MAGIQNTHGSEGGLTGVDVSNPVANRQDQYTNFGLSTSQVDPRTGMAGQFDFGLPGSRNNPGGGKGPNVGSGPGFLPPPLNSPGPQMPMGMYNPGMGSGLGLSGNSAALYPTLNQLRLQMLAQGYYLPFLQSMRR
jgi:hypothetical protein